MLLASKPPFTALYKRRNTVSAVAVWTVEYDKYTSAPNRSDFLVLLASNPPFTARYKRRNTFLAQLVILRLPTLTGLAENLKQND